MSDDMDALAAASNAADNNAIDEAVDRAALLIETRERDANMLLCLGHEPQDHDTLARAPV